jgi:hypothetical protein
VKLRIVTLVMLLALFGGVLVHGPLLAAAQDTAASPAPGLKVGELDGIKQDVRRTYIAGADTGKPAGASIGLLSLVGETLQFTDGGKAADAFGPFSDAVTMSIASAQGGQPKEDVIEGFGDNTRAYSATVKQQGISAPIFVVLTQQDEYIYFSLGLAISGDLKNATVDFAKALIDGKAGDGEGQLNADGTSTGGVWDKFPAADDKVIQGLKPIADTQIFPTPTS